MLGKKNLKNVKTKSLFEKNNYFICKCQNWPLVMVAILSNGG
jgi:hypothetical protein